ncbi:MAG: IclR family transcriptional regulator [Clostridia bacterium]|nr:IclR family transcriptional regulator [Clostridia bacterium]
MQTQKKATGANLSVIKAFNLIEVMAYQPGPMRLQDIARLVGAPSSSVLRLLSSLMSMGYVNQNKDLRYSLSLKFSLIGRLVSAQTDLHGIIHPHLIELEQICQESACMAIEQDMRVLYADVIHGPDNLLKTTQYIGKTAPMHCTGVGKLLMTNYSDSDIDRYIETRGLHPYTEHTIKTKEELLDELTRIRSQGYALDDEECELGARCIAAPIYDYTKQVVACISVSGPVSRMSHDRLGDIRPTILEFSKQISETLSYSEQMR